MERVLFLYAKGAESWGRIRNPLYKEDEPLAADRYVEKIIEAVKANAEHFGFDVPEIWIEPGRSLVGDAGTTLYTIGSKRSARHSQVCGG